MPSHAFFVLAELILIGSHYAVPELPPLLGQAMFWTGIAGLFLYPLWIRRKWIVGHVGQGPIVIGCLLGAALFLAAAACVRYKPTQQS
jgi:hypothetical protein